MSSRYDASRFHHEWYATVTIPMITSSDRVRQHKQADIERVSPGPYLPSWPRPVPGDMVRECHDSDSFGVVVVASDDSCSVLWSVAPRWYVPDVDLDIQSFEIKAQSRQLKVGWSVSEEDGPTVVGNLSEALLQAMNRGSSNG